MPDLRVSAIIPTLNEAACLRDCLEVLRGQASLAEVLVVDGDSEDATPRIAERAAPGFQAAGARLRLLRAEAGRAVQMNAGAVAAKGDVLLFLHADTMLPTDGIEAVTEAIRQGSLGGAFSHRFVEEDPRLRLISWYANLRSRLARIFFGDQAIFVRKDVFEAMGGFRPLPIMEDLDFSARLRSRGRTALLALAARTSGRRFLSQGIGRTCLRLVLLRMAYRMGADPEDLNRRYREVR